MDRMTLERTSKELSANLAEIRVFLGLYLNGKEQNTRLLENLENKLFKAECKVNVFKKDIEDFFGKEMVAQ